MCSSKPKPPPVIYRDPVADAAKAAAVAQNKANSETAMRRKRLRQHSLYTVGARGISGNPAFSAYGRAIAQGGTTTLGGT